MVKIIYLDNTPKQQENIHDPHKLLNIYVGGKHTFARPTKFNTDDYGVDYVDSNGDKIYPIEAITICPDCGNQIKLTNLSSSVAVCTHCDLGKEELDKQFAPVVMEQPPQNDPVVVEQKVIKQPRIGLVTLPEPVVNEQPPQQTNIYRAETPPLEVPNKQLANQDTLDPFCNPLNSGRIKQEEFNYVDQDLNIPDKSPEDTDIGSVLDFGPELDDDENV